MRDMQQQMQTPATPPANNAADKPKEEKKDEKPAEPKKDEGPAPITRPPAYDNSASLAEQKMVVDAKHKISFNFQEAPWTFVLEELASVSGANLDWNQLPGDSFNLRSNNKYTAAEARDIINEHLMARGYSILYDAKASSMTVVNLDTMNTALVPRVAPEDLDGLPPHDLVKVSFRLDWLIAKDAVDEFKQVLSPKAKLLPLKTTNRLEAIDSVINLKQLAQLLEEEQGRGSMDRLAKEFELRYTRAPEVVEQLELYLGLKKPGAATGQAGGDPMQQMMMQRMQMMQQQQGQPQGQQPAAMPQLPEIHLLANTRRNTVIVNAPPDKMGIIKATIWKIDVPSDRPNLSENTQLMQSYHLATLEPEVVVNFLESVGDLDPQTKLDVDKKTHTVIAYATAKDHKVIAALVKNLDGSDRILKVIQLRRLDADLVAGTLRTLLVGDDKNANNNNNNNSRRYGWFNPFGSSPTPEDTNASKFRVEADVIENRIMVWANTIELEQVYKCLSELGEVPRRERSTETLRVLDLGSGDDEQVFLERLRRLWPTLGKNGNKLIIDAPKKEMDKSGGHSAPDESKPDQGVQKAPAIPSASNSNDKSGTSSAGTAEQSSSLMPAPRFQLADFKQAVATSDKAVADSGQDSTKSNPSSTDSHRGGLGRHHRGKASLDRVTETPPQTAPSTASQEKETANQPAEKSSQGDPIYITRGANGRLVVTSRDTEALDALQEMVGRLAPPKKDYAVYYLKHADCYAVKLNLDEFFQTEKKDSSEDRMRRFWWDDSSGDKKDDTPKLSKRKPLRFIDDSQTNSLLVQGGTSDQLRQIEELVKMYDNPKPTNTRPARVTQIFYIKHSKASVIAEVIKDTYRDLLSTKDKALESYNQTKSQGKSGGRGYISYDFGEHDDDGKMSQSRFSGSLSMGIDDSTNSLVISCATQNMLLSIKQLVDSLDTAAVPAAQTFQVLQINRAIDTNNLQKKLSELLKKPTAGSQEQAAQPGQNGQQQQQRRGGRGNQMHQGGGENNGNE
jgi:type II secretory pathway component GspD/PulD (secretin)